MPSAKSEPMLQPGGPQSTMAPAPRRMALAALLLIAIVGVIAYPSFGLGADTRTAGDVVVGPAERITNDLYVAAGTLDFNGQADGDVVVLAGEAMIGGTIAGSVQLATGQSEITGTIDGSLRVLSGSVRISGSVEGDVVVMAGQIELPASGQVGGDLILAGGSFDIRGRVEGDVSGSVLQATLGGTVQGEVDVNTSNLDVLDTARVAGPVTYTGRQDADVDAEAQLAQGIQQEEVNPSGGDSDNPLSRASGSLLRTLWALVAGALLVIAAPRLANQLGHNGKRLPRSLAFGVLAMIAVPILAIILMLTVVGLPAGIVLLTIFFVALYLSQVIVGMAIGRFILPGSWNDGSRGFHLLAMTLGVVLLGALRLIPVPYVYALASVVITVWGVGAVLMLVGTLNRQSRVETA